VETVTNDWPGRDAFHDIYCVVFRKPACRRAFLFQTDFIKHFFDCPNVICKARFHRGSHAQSFVNATKIIIHVVSGNCRDVVVDLLEPLYFIRPGPVARFDLYKEPRPFR
jgi:hypothetical protein